MFWSAAYRLFPLLGFLLSFHVIATGEPASAVASQVALRQFAHPALGLLVSYSTGVLPKWSGVRSSLEEAAYRGGQTVRLRAWSRWGRLQSVKGTPDRRALAERIHRRLSAIGYLEDRGGDYWQTPKETLERLGGDCEDQAILGLHLALAAGVPAGEAGLAVGYDKLGRAHAALVLLDRGDIILVDINEASVVRLERSGFEAKLIAFRDQVWVVTRPRASVLAAN